MLAFLSYDGIDLELFRLDDNGVRIEYGVDDPIDLPITV